MTTTVSCSSSIERSKTSLVLRPMLLISRSSAFANVPLLPAPSESRTLPFQTERFRSRWTAFGLARDLAQGGPEKPGGGRAQIGEHFGGATGLVGTLMRLEGPLQGNHHVPAPGRGPAYPW